MTKTDSLKRQRATSLELTAGGPPARIGNPFFGVGPITDGVAGHDEARADRAAFEAWVTATYRKLDDTGRDIGGFTVAELNRSIHRGHPADKVLTDMMREIHRYFGFGAANKMAVGLGGGHSGFTVAAMHFLSTSDPGQQVFIDTCAPESDAAKESGFFRQSWGAQLVELLRHAKGGDESRLHFATREGIIPSADELDRMGISIFIGVGHETTGATCYSADDISHLLTWLGRDPARRHAVIDVTSLLGAMPWDATTIAAVMSKCCLFTPFQKAIGGVSGYYIMSFTPQAMDYIEHNQLQPSWAIPRQLKLAAPVDPKMPLTGKRSVSIGPFYDPAADKMVGGVINTFSVVAFVETTYGLLRTQTRVGDVVEQNRRSIANRQAVADWIGRQRLFALGVEDPAQRGAAVTLLKVMDPDITDPAVRTRIVVRSKQILSYEGATHPNGVHEAGLDVARYINAFPGTSGDYRAWIGGIRPVSDIVAFLDNLQYAYHRAKIVVLEEELAKAGETFAA